jgi:hypothetical protein
MLGGAALNSGQCNPPAIICLRRRNKVQRPEATEAGFFVDLAELPLEFRDLIPMRLGKSSSGVNPTGSVHVVAGRQQLHFFWAEQNI